MPQTVVRPWYSALICGASLPQSYSKQELVQTGLLHIVLLSGAHFIWLERAGMSWLPTWQSRSSKARWVMGLPRLFVWTSLLTFLLASQISPRLLRTVLWLAFSLINEKASLGWTLAQRATMSGLVSLTFCQDSSEIESLRLSWSVALTLIMIRDQERFDRTQPHVFSKSTSKPWSSFVDRRRRALISCTLVYLALFPLLLPLAFLDPLTILWNWLLAPLLSLLLFPGSLLTVLAIRFNAALSAPMDTVWSWALVINGKLASRLSETPDRLAIGSGWLWIYLMSLTFFALYRDQSQRRRES